MATRTSFGRRQIFGQPAPQPRPAAASTCPEQEATPEPEIVAEQRPRTIPFLTIGLTALLIAVFLFELSHPINPLPYAEVSIRDRVALGGISRYLVFHEQEWWRILTAPFLHAFATEIVGNTIALIFAGVLLERIVGRVWFAALFVLGLLGNSLGSLLYSDDVVSVGASGTIMCLSTVLFALSFHRGGGKNADWMRLGGIVGAISAFLPTTLHGAVPIDYGTYLGGFVTGIVLGFLLLILWVDEETPRPPLRALAACAAVAGTLAALYAASLVANKYDFYAARSSLLIPIAEQRLHPELADQWTDLVARYPHDPLVRLLRGMDFINRHDFSDAEDEARAGLAEQEILATQYTPEMASRLNTLLAVALWDGGRHHEAKQVAAPLCTSTPSDGYLARSRLMFQRVGLCNEGASSE